MSTRRVKHKCIHSTHTHTNTYTHRDKLTHSHTHTHTHTHAHGLELLWRSIMLSSLCVFVYICIWEKRRCQSASVFIQYVSIQVSICANEFVCLCVCVRMCERKIKIKSLQCILPCSYRCAPNIVNVNVNVNVNANRCLKRFTIISEKWCVLLAMTVCKSVCICVCVRGLGQLHTVRLTVSMLGHGWLSTSLSFVIWD